MAGKRFLAPDMRSALRQVREELGADAVILSHRRVAGGIELEAAADATAVVSAPRPRAAATLTAPRPASATHAANDRAGADLQWPAAEPQQDSEWSRIQDEMRSMRALLEQQLSSSTWRQLEQQRPAQAGMWRRLNRMGLDAELCRLLLAGFDERQPPAQAWQKLMNDLAGLLPVTAVDPVLQGGVFAFLGPAGAGKTTCIAKLATRYALAHGSEGLALITTDRYRIGAQEQLRTISKILNVPLLAAKDQSGLEDLLYRLRHHRLVLVDTAGFSRRDPQLPEQLAMLDALGDRIQVLQVLPATSQYPVMKADQHAYRCHRLSGLILTKLDETASLGEPVSLMVRRNLALAYTSDGQNIPNDLAPANPRQLIAAAIGLARQRELDEQRLAQAMASIPAH